MKQKIKDYLGGYPKGCGRTRREVIGGCFFIMLAVALYLGLPGYVLELLGWAAPIPEGTYYEIRDEIDNSVFFRNQ